MSEFLVWSDYRDWSDLLDALCNSQGHFDNARLASDLCALSKSDGQAAYETALRNLANWRRGQHVPHRRNFAALSALLNIDSHDGLRAHWNRLYTEARQSRNGTADEAEDMSGAEIGDVIGGSSGGVFADLLADRSRIVAVAALPVMLLLAGAGYVYHLEYGVEPEPPFIPASIRHKMFVSLNVGESAVIHGIRGDCGQQPPEWNHIFPGLPKLATGDLSDGGPGVRFSRACGGNTPARAITFTARRPGKEQVTLFSDTTVIEVK